MVTIYFGRFREMKSGLACVRPMRFTHLGMHRKQIALHQHQITAPIVRIQAVKFDPLPRFKATLRLLLPLLLH